jgi:hypothetical protein
MDLSTLFIGFVLGFLAFPILASVWFEMTGGK